MKLLQLALVAFALTGCMTGGKEFNRIETGEMVYGTTTTADVLQKLGDPFRSGSESKFGKTFDTIAYAFSKSGGEAGIEDVTPARSQGFYFHNDVLVGSEFTSSWKVDFTDFDETKINKIKENKTTVTELTALLGPARGEYIYPLVENKNEKAKIYLLTYAKISGLQIQAFSKHLIVSYNIDTGIVSNVEYKSQGNE